MTSPRISVFINTYNHERYVEQAMVSALEQDFPSAETEILVIDDGSTDRTPEIIRKFEPRVRHLRKENGGQVSAYNAALRELHGEIVCFLDGDDWWPRGKLRAVAQAFEKNPDIAAVGHAYYDVYESTPREIIAPEETARLDLSSVEAARLAEAASTLLVTSRLSARRAILERIGQLPVEAVFFDTLVFTLSFALGGAIVLDEPLCYYRHHAGSLHNPLEVDPTTRRRRMRALSFRLQYLPSRLFELGVPKDTVDAFMEPRRVECERETLRWGEGISRRDVYRGEMRRFRSQYKRANLGYKFFQCAVGASALLLAPRQFYRLFDWYGRNNLQRVRKLLGKADPIVPAGFIRRRPI